MRRVSGTHGRALVNFNGNAVAPPVIAKWDKTLDLEQARRVLATTPAPEGSTAGDEEARRDAADRDAVAPGPDPAGATAQLGAGPRELERTPGPAIR